MKCRFLSIGVQSIGSLSAGNHDLYSRRPTDTEYRLFDVVKPLRSLSKLSFLVSVKFFFNDREAYIVSSHDGLYIFATNIVRNLPLEKQKKKQTNEPFTNFLLLLFLTTTTFRNEVMQNENEHKEKKNRW